MVDAGRILMMKARAAHSAVKTTLFCLTVFLLCSFSRASFDERALGILNVTQPPYNVDNTGTHDVTEPLQKAIVDAHNNFLVLYFPLGTYLVSSTLTAFDNNSCTHYSCSTNNTNPCRFQPNVFMGERSRCNGTDASCVRPVIRLADRSPPFQNKSMPLPVVDFTMTRDPTHPAQVSGVNFNQVFKGIDVHLGHDNPGAIGVQLPGAQGSSVQDCTITAYGAYAGIRGGAGAGGSHEMVTVLGGEVGLDYTVTLNAPAITGMRLYGQTKASILYVGLEAGSVVGADIRPSEGAAALLSLANDTKWGQLSFVDTVISYAASAHSASCIALRTTHSIFAQNVYVLNCGTLVDLSPALNYREKGNPTGWAVMRRFAVGVPIHGSATCKPAIMPLYLDGARDPFPMSVNVSVPSSGPPPTLLTQHRWDEPSFPTFDQTHGLLNVKLPPFNAVGDGQHDDTVAIQSAIDSSDPDGVVFLPKGFYRISRTLNISKGVSLLGMSRTLSVIMPMSHGLVGMTGPSGTAFPMLHVSGAGRVVLSQFTLVTWEHLSTVYALQWDNKNRTSVYRQNYFFRTTECLYGFPHPLPRPSPVPTMPCTPSANLSHPLNVITGSIRAYNFENEDFLYENPDYRHMLVVGNDATDQIRFYEANFEHTAGEANMEIRDAHNVLIYSFKTEGLWGGGTRGYWWMHNPDVAIWVRNSTNVAVYSHGGNARPMPTGSKYPVGYAQYPPTLYRLENSCPVLLTNLVDQFQFTPDNDWNFVYEQYSGVETLTEHCERPAMFSRTSCVP